MAIYWACIVHDILGKHGLVTEIFYRNHHLTPPCDKTSRFLTYMVQKSPLQKLQGTKNREDIIDFKFTNWPCACINDGRLFIKSAVDQWHSSSVH